MAWGEGSRWITRAIGQASAYVAFWVALVELLRRERVVTAAAFTPRSVLLVAVVWCVVVVWRGWREARG
jgi:hypothetical protein